MKNTTVVVTPGEHLADLEEIASLFSSRSARSYAAQLRELRNESINVQPKEVALNKAFSALRWHANHANS